MQAADARKDKIVCSGFVVGITNFSQVFPFSNQLAILLKPWFPSFIARMVKKKAGGSVQKDSVPAAKL